MINTTVDQSFGAGDLCELSRKIVGRVVTRKAQLFKYFQWLSSEDLHAEAMTAVRAAWPKYDPDKSAASTFIYMVASRRIMDLYRVANHLRTHERTFTAGNRNAAPPSNRHEPDDLIDWIKSTLTLLRRNFTTHGVPFALPNISPDVLDRAQAATLLALQTRFQMNVYGLRKLLANRPDLALIIGLRVPLRCRQLTGAWKAFPKVTLGGKIECRPAA